MLKPPTSVDFSLISQPGCQTMPDLALALAASAAASGAGSGQEDPTKLAELAELAQGAFRVSRSVHFLSFFFHGFLWVYHGFIMVYNGFIMVYNGLS
jgi:hypothetical protein